MARRGAECDARPVRNVIGLLVVTLGLGCSRAQDAHTQPSAPAPSASTIAEGPPAPSASTPPATSAASPPRADAAPIAPPAPPALPHASKDGWVDAPVRADAKHRPVLALSEGGNLVNSTLPVLTVYEDGLVLRRDSERATETHVRDKHLHPADMRMAQLPAADVAKLVAAVRATGLEQARGQTIAASATDQPSADILLRQGDRWKVTSVFGITHRKGEPVRADGGPMSEVPAAFVAAYRMLLAFEPKALGAWTPDEVVATLSKTTKPASTSMPWPADLPAPERGGGKATPLVLSGKDARAMLEWNRKLGSMWDVLEKKPGRSDIELGGERWSLTVTGVVPEATFLESVRLAAVLAR